MVPNLNQNLSSDQETLIELKSITKVFPGVTALDGVDLSIRKGENHVLLGENGAGKSTLIKIIAGVEHPNSGSIYWQGEEVEVKNTREAHQMGVSVIYQELSNIQCLSVIENMFVGNELTYDKKGIFINWKEQYQTALKFLRKVGCMVDPNTICETLGMGQKQLIEIAKAIMRNAKLIIMDEPTSSLSRSEIDHLLKLMEELKKEGVSILFITHKLDEAQKVGDRVTVLKDGKKVGDTMNMEEVDEDKIIKMMVGRTLDEKYPKRNVAMGNEVLRVEKLCGGAFEDISFSLRKGELLGIFGLVGAGRTEMVRALFGADRKISGKVFIHGKEISIRRPIDAINQGIVLLTENRKEEGLILIHDVVENVTLPTINQFRNKIGILNNAKRYSTTSQLGRQVNLRPLHVRKHSMNFSGGNQQKIVIEKWLLSNAAVYIFDEPTKGVDVGAKTEIYTIMNRLLEEGASIIMVSSEMQEILGMSDTIMLMYEGESKGILENSDEITHEKIMTLITGGK